jgi:hypothetical protein
MSDAVKLAHQWFEQQSADDACDYATQLADAVIAQADEIAKLKAALGEALAAWRSSDVAWEHRIAELRRLL